MNAQTVEHRLRLPELGGVFGGFPENDLAHVVFVGVLGKDDDGVRFDSPRISPHSLAEKRQLIFRRGNEV